MPMSEQQFIARVRIEVLAPQLAELGTQAPGRCGWVLSRMRLSSLACFGVVAVQ